jgi:hypothetical protein
MFPNAEITAAEIDRTALDFCRRHFAVTAYLSKTSLSDLTFPGDLTSFGAAPVDAYR